MSSNVNNNVRVDRVSQGVPVRGRSFANFDFSSFHGPLSDEDRTAVTQLFSSVSGDRAEQMRSLSLELANQLMSPGATTMGGDGSVTMSQGLQDASSSAMTFFLAAQGSDSMSNQDQNFMMLAIGGMEATLGGFAATVSNNNQNMKDVRTDATELQEMLTGPPPWGDDEVKSFTYHEVTYDQNGNPTVKEITVDLDKKGAEALLTKLDEQMKTMSDMSEMDKFDMQRLYQDYQTGVNTLASIIKSDDDAKKAILNNIKA